jgi:hypothetical protein
MNSGTLVASLIMAALLVLLIAFVIQMMMRAWRGRARRQAELIGTLPPVPDTVGSPIVEPTRGVDLGYRSKAVLTRYPEGIMVQRSGASPIWIPQESIAAVRTERGMVGKAMTTNGILAIRWRLPSGAEIDLGFRGNDRGEYTRWLPENTR